MIGGGMRYLVMVLSVLIALCSDPVVGADKVVVVPLIKKVVEPAPKPPPATSKLVFVTKEAWPGNLGGVSGADDKCNAEATERNFTGTFQAVLGSFEGGMFAHDPWRRSIHYPLPYLREDGEDLQSDFHDLFSSGPDSSVTTDAQYHPWTGLDASGNKHLDNCNGWSDSTIVHNGVVGDSQGIGGNWVNASIISCDNSRPVYCIEQ